MTEEIREKALRALKNAKCAHSQDEHFPMVFVCGEHVFFTFMAAYRQQQEYRILNGMHKPIEIMHTPYSIFVNHKVNQRGEVMPYEVFPLKEYAKSLAD